MNIRPDDCDSNGQPRYAFSAIGAELAIGIPCHNRGGPGGADPPRTARPTDGESENFTVVKLPFGPIAIIGIVR